MSCRPHKLILFFLVVTVGFSGCYPTQPMYLRDNGNLSYYLEQATQIDYPDVQAARLDEVARTRPPITVENPDFDSFYDLTLEECVGIALQNSKIIRGFGTPNLQGSRISPGIDITQIAAILKASSNLNVGSLEDQLVTDTLSTILKYEGDIRKAQQELKEYVELQRAKVKAPRAQSDKDLLN